MMLCSALSGCKLARWQSGLHPYLRAHSRKHNATLEMDVMFLIDLLYQIWVVDVQDRWCIACVARQS